MSSYLRARVFNADGTPVSIANNPLAIDVLLNDSDSEGNTLTITDFTNPTNGSLTQNPDGTFKYISNLNFNGTDSFEYTVSDGNGGISTATVNIAIPD